MDDRPWYVTCFLHEALDQMIFIGSEGADFDVSFGADSPSRTRRGEKPRCRRYSYANASPSSTPASLVALANPPSAPANHHCRRRMAYSAVDAPGLTYHHASMQIVEDGPGRCVFVWITDFLPAEAGDTIMPLIEQGARALKNNLEKLT